MGWFGKDKKVIKVTEEHIRKGIRKNANCCPVALAVKDYFNTDDVVVSIESILVHNRTNPILYEWDSINQKGKDIVKLIQYFDAGIPIAPFEFELNDPENLEGYVIICKGNRK